MPNSTFMISGIVYRPDSTNPVGAGVRVLVTNQSNNNETLETKTDSNGAFELNLGNMNTQWVGGTILTGNRLFLVADAGAYSACLTAVIGTTDTEWSLGAGASADLYLKAGSCVIPHQTSPYGDVLASGATRTSDRILESAHMSVGATARRLLIVERNTAAIKAQLMAAASLSDSHTFGTTGKKCKGGFYSMFCVITENLHTQTVGVANCIGDKRNTAKDEVASIQWR